MMRAYKSNENHSEFNDLEDTDDISDDEVFIRDSKHGLDDDNGVNKPLMAPRRKHFKSNSLHTQVKRIPPCQALLAPICYGLIAFGALIGLVCLIVFLVNVFSDKLSFVPLRSNYSNGNLPVGCSHLEVEDVWIQTFPKLLTESAIRLNDVNQDGVLDVILGFATGVDGYHVPIFVCDIYFDGVKPCFGGVLALDGKTGHELWRHYTDHEVFALNCNEDLNGDEVNDCLAAGRAGTFQAISGKDGKFIWNFGPQKAKNEIMNIYTAQFLPDQDGDGIVDVLAVHGGDPLADPGSKYRLSGRILLLSGKDGKVLKWLGVPDGKESYYSPQLIIHPDGTELVIFGTGGETHSGGLWYLALNDLIKGNIQKAQLIYKDPHKGAMAPPVIADITSDGIEDIIIAMFNSTIIAFNGLDFKQIWNYTIPSSESYSTPAAGYYNEDDTLDFLIKYQIGPGFPIYYYSQTTVLSGSTGKPLLNPPVQDTIGSQASGITISMEGQGNDLFLYWTSDCLNHEGETQEFSFVKGTNVHEQSRTDFCQVRFNSRLISRLFAIGQHFKSPGIVIYHSDERRGIEYNNTVNTTAIALEYVSKHPDIWHLYRQSNSLDSSSTSPVEPNLNGRLRLEKSKSQKPNLLRRPVGLVPAFTNAEYEEDIAYPHRHNVRKHGGRDKGANDRVLPLNYLDSLSQDYYNQNGGDSEMQDEGIGNSWNGDFDNSWDKNYDNGRLEDNSYRPNEGYRKINYHQRNKPNYYKGVRRDQYRDDEAETDWNAGLDYTKRFKRDPEKSKFFRVKRHVGPHDNEGIQRLISTGTLAPVLDPTDPIANHSIDLIFATYWFFPAKTQAILPEDRDCIQNAMAHEQQRFEEKNDYYGMDHDAYEASITKECLEKNGRGTVTNQTFETQKDYDPLNIHMGQMTVYRVRLLCTCKGDARVEFTGRTCAKTLPFESQGWAAYMGTRGDSHFVKRRKSPDAIF